MGVKITGPAKRNSRVSEIQEGAGVQGNQAAGGTGAKGASDPAAATAGNSGTGAASGSSVADITVITSGQKTQSVGLPAVKEEIPPPKQQKPKRQKAKPPTKSSDTQLTAEMIAQVLGVTFNLLATRMGPHWALSQAEAQALADPTARILARYDLTSKTGAYADFIALGVAVVGIVIPKFLIHSATKKPKIEGEIKRVEPVREQRRSGGAAGDANTQARTPNSPSPGVDRPTTASGPRDVGIKQHLGQVISAF